MKLAALLLLLAVVASVAAILVRRRGGRRQRAVGELLDAADALETRLRMARTELEAVMGEDGNPTREAMQEMLRQRLWLQQHGDTASLEQIDSVRSSLEQARERIEQQLARLRDARAPLA